jgi:HSP20 family molecular chaperone IbpA
MEESRYEISKQYLVHGKWLATAVKLDTHLRLKLKVAGFVFDDIDVHNNTNKIHGLRKRKDDLYYFTNDASIVESSQTIRENKLNQLGIK